MKANEKKCRLLIPYGSQTGTWQDLAEHIWRESRKYNFIGPVMAMDDYDIRNLIEENLVIFVCSTAGQGDEPDNMKKFWKFLLRKSLPRDSLADMSFGVLGLGDSSYAQYNFVAKRLHKRLLQLSANSLMPLGLCDDVVAVKPCNSDKQVREECWLRTLGARKLCPQCKMITSPSDLRRIYM